MSERKRLEEIADGVIKFWKRGLRSCRHNDDPNGRRLNLEEGTEILKNLIIIALEVEIKNTQAAMVCIGEYEENPVA